MAEDNNIFDELESSSSEPAIGQDYADWWVPENDQLMGVIVEVHSAPEQYTEQGEVPDPIYTVVSIGRGNFDAGQARCTKTHVQLLSGLENAGLNDLVNLKHKGLQRTEGGNAANTYEIGVIPEDAWHGSEQKEKIEEVIEGYGGAKGDNRMTEPYSTGGSSSQSGGSSGSDDGASGELAEACDFMEDVVIDMQGGSMPVENANQMLHDVRDLDVDIEEVAEEMGWTVEDDTVSAE